MKALHVASEWTGWNDVELIPIVLDSKFFQHMKQIFIVQLLERKFYLLKEGDELDERIRKAEKQIRATENTLFLANAINGTLKQQLAIRLQHQQQQLKQNVDDYRTRTCHSKYKYL